MGIVALGAGIAVLTGIGAGWTDQQEPDFRLRSGRSHRNLWSAGGHPADFHELIGGVAR